MLNIRGFFGIFIFVSFISMKNFQVNYNLETLETAKGCQIRFFTHLEGNQLKEKSLA